MYEVKTDQFKKQRNVLIDDMKVTVTQIGAGSQLTFSQIQRRLEFLDKKMKAGTTTEADLDLFESLERKMLDFFAQVINDGTPDNKHVKAWINATPLEVIQATFEEMQRQFKETDEKTPDAIDPAS